MKLVATATLLAALAGGAHSICSQSISGTTCSGDTTDSGCVSEDSCFEITTGVYGIIDCQNGTSIANWNYKVYTTSDCSGTPFFDRDGSGTNCAVGSGDDSLIVDCGASCFSGTDTAQLEGGATVPVAELSVGDRVLATDSSGNLFYDKVHRVPHWDASQPQDYVRITTASGRVIEASRGHYLHAGSCCSLDKLTLAMNVREGDDLFTVSDETGGLAADAVVSAEPVRKEGAFNVHTLSGNIVVNGVAASHFSSETTWGEKTRPYAPLWYKALDLWHSLVGGAEDARRGSN